MELDPEQQMEHDMLMAMYPDHVSAPAPCEITDGGMGGLPSYYVDVAPEDGAPSELRLTIAMPVGYPSGAEFPKLHVESISNERRVPTGGLLKELSTLMDEQGGGMVAVAVLQKCQEQLLELDRAAAADSAVKKQEVIELDPTIHLGVSVTPEVFSEWRDKFKAEKEAKAAKEAAKSGKAKLLKKGLTGKQMWDTTIKDADWALFEAGEGGAADDDAEDVDFNMYDCGEEDEEAEVEE